MMRLILSSLVVLLVCADAYSGPLLRRRSTPQPVQDRYYPVRDAGHILPQWQQSQGVLTNETPVLGQNEALSEVNAKRAMRGLRPYIFDAGLTQAAQSCASFRASRHMFGHTGNDFQFLPSGSHASSAGCAAYPASYGWMSCDVYDNYTYAGAAWAMGADGKRYMHIFVR